MKVSNSNSLRCTLLLELLGFSVTAFIQHIWGCRNSMDTCRTAFTNKPSRSCFLAKNKSILYQQPPPGSGYLGAEDEKSALPDTYEPTMEYPGTLRPGRTRENISFQDLPIGDDDPDPIPWPHFQEIDYYHIWPAPHPNPEPVNDMIAKYGRWATPEEEAEMMRDARRGVRLMKEMQEAEKKAFVLVDDDDDDPLQEVEEVDDVLAEQITRGKQTNSKPQKPTDSIMEGDDETIDFSELNFDDGDEVEDDMEDDDFLLELGLDEEEAVEDIITNDDAKTDESELIDASTEETVSNHDVADAEVLDDIVGTEVLDDIVDADSVLGLNNFDDEEDDYYLGRNEDDYGDLDAYDDDEGVY